jgi:predicted RNA binding protein YcfA (HicA-like mRNA interferase family)
MTAYEVVKILKAHGWVFDRIESSHHIYKKPGYRPIPVPFHGNKDLGLFAKTILGKAKIKITENKKKKR